MFVAGSADRLFVLFGISYSVQIWIMRVAVWVLPLIALVIVKRVCDELVRGEQVEVRRKAAEAEAMA